MINLLVLIVLVGMGLWLINNFIPMAGLIKSLLNLLVLILLIIYIAQFFGLIKPMLPLIRILQ
jgi:hypothetical protein